MGAKNPFNIKNDNLDLAFGAKRYTQSTMSYVSLKSLNVSIKDILTVNSSFLLMNSDIFHEIDIKNLPQNVQAAHLIGVPNPHHNSKGDDQEIYRAAPFQTFQWFYDLKNRIAGRVPTARYRYAPHRVV